jgi:hypothetical protein
MHSIFPQLLHEGGKTEMNKVSKRHVFVTFFPEIPQRVTLVCVNVSVLLYSILSVQRVYSVQLNCTDSNYTQAAATRSAAQQHSTFTVQILYIQFSLKMKYTYSNYTQAAATFSCTTAHKLKLMSSEGECSQLSNVLCIYR